MPVHDAFSTPPRTTTHDKTRTLNTIEGIRRKCRGLIRDHEQTDGRHAQTPNPDGISSAAKGELPVITDDWVNADTSSKGDGRSATSINKS